MSLTAQGTVRINGYGLGVETETRGVSIKPILSSCGRTIIANQYEFTIYTIIARFAGDGEIDNDDTLEDLRTRVLRNGGTFEYSSKGLGDIRINVAGGQRDMNWGPRIEQIDWKPIGGNLAGELTFKVSFQTLDCSGAQFQFGLMEFVYKVTLSQGRDRMTTRNHSGHLRIPQTRSSIGVKNLTDSADNYYDAIVPPIPVNFRREAEERTIDESKCRLDFSFRDVQLKMPLLIGLVEMDLTHDQQNSQANQFAVKTGTISFSCQVAYHYAMVLAELHFFQIVKQKILEIIFWDKYTVIPAYYRAREDTQNRRASFSFSYMICKGKTPGEKVPAANWELNSAGFWRKILGLDGKGGTAFADNTLWAESMLPGTVPRGYTQELIGPDADAIVDLCRASEVKKPADGGDVGSLADLFASAMPAECPDENNSWIWWENNYTFSTDDGLIIQKPLPKTLAPDPNSTRPSLVDQLESGNGFVSVLPGTTPTGDDPPIRMQRRTAPVVYVWMTGYAVRMCYDIPEPVLVSIGDADAYPANRPEQEYFTTRLWGNIGIPIAIAKWNRRYVLTQTPQEPMGVGGDDQVGPLIPSADNGSFVMQPTVSPGDGI